MIFAAHARAHVSPCPSLGALTTGTEISYHTYDGRDRLTQTQHLTVASNRVESGYQTVYFDEELRDSRGRITARGERVVRCQNDILFFDMTKMIPSEALRGAETMEIRSDQNLLRLPLDLVPGQMLPQARTSMEVGPEASGSLMTLDFSITNRMVESVADLETPAGVFNTVLVTQRSTSRSKVLMLRKTWEYDEKVWYEFNKGLTVRSETYDAKGRLKSYTVLSRLE